MRITRIREASASIASEIRNACISFATMAVGLVAVETNVVLRLGFERVGQRPGGG